MKICIEQENIPNIDGLIELLTELKNNQIKIMSAIDDLKTQVTNLQTQVNDLQTALDNEQAQIQQLLDTNAQVVTDLNTQISNLKDQIANGATPEQLQDIATGLSAISDSLATTKTDLEGTVPDNASSTPTV